MKTSPAGEDYFDLGDYSIQYRPDYPVNDEAYLLRGITQVLAETFLFPAFFSKEVTVRPGDTVLDLGGNIGTTALLFSKQVGEHGRVFAFEPVVHAVLRENLAKNGVRNAEVIPKGVSSETGTARIEISDFCLDSSLVHREEKVDHYRESRDVELIRLDDFVAERKLDRVDFIKMDIEGAEEMALCGARETIERFRPKWSISSYHTDFSGEPQHEKLLRILRGHGYRIRTEKNRHIYAW